MIAAPPTHGIAGPHRAAVPSILLIDDNPVDAELMRIAVEMSAVDYQLVWVPDGQSAFHELERCRADGRPPDLILLDLNMPRMHGTEVLSRLQADGITRRIPVVVLSTFGQPGDRTRLLLAGASEFLLKPDGIRDLVALVGRLRTFFSMPAAGLAS